MPRLSIGRDHERWGLLGMERAQALVCGAGALERDGLAHQVDDGHLGLDLGGEA
jgi:hypothetical protein